METLKEGTWYIKGCEELEEYFDKNNINFQGDFSTHGYYIENGEWDCNIIEHLQHRIELTYSEFIKLFEVDTCPKCRTKDFKNCHSIKCPMRKEELFEDGEGENNGWIKIKESNDLPRQRGEFWFVSQLEKGKIVKAYFNHNSSLDGNKAHYVKLYSHYQPIQKPLPPKF